MRLLVGSSTLSFMEVKVILNKCHSIRPFVYGVARFVGEEIHVQVRAYLLKESFDGFWSYSSPYWAGWYLDRWCVRAMRSRLEPIKKFVGTLRNHRELLLNWFRAKKEISCGVVEGLNTNVKLAVRKARGFESYDVAGTALYHELGRLPEPQFTHSFC